MFEHDYRAKFDEIAPDRALVEGTRDRMRKALSGEKARPRRLTRRGLVAAAAAAHPLAGHSERLGQPGPLCHRGGGRL